MRAARFHEYGDLDGITVEEVPEPLPGAGEISLRVRAAGVNPIDWKIMHGIYSGGQPLAAAQGIGVDVAGTVERVGPGVSGIAPGAELLGSPISPAFAEVALSRPELLVAKPAGVSWEVAGSLAVVVGTAYAALERLGLKEGETLLILGASGGVGLVAIQLAVARGVRVIGTGGPARLEQLERVGALGVAYGEGLEERLGELAPDGVDAALEASGHGELAAALALTRDSRRVLSIASSAEAQELGVAFHAGGGGELLIPALEQVLPLIEAGTFFFPIAGVYDLGQVGEALRESEHGHPAGKLVIVPQ
jgi:NADPH:quinone reductase-like Zn-dependent oxidoreductase